MSERWIALDPEKHRAHGWKRHDHYRFTAAEAWAPLLIAELPAALPLYALAFAPRDGEGGEQQLVVLQGLHAGDNLFLDVHGRWQGGYVPSCYRAYPFRLEPARVEGQARTLIYFDRSSGLYREQPDEARGEARFFDDAGKLTPLLERLVNFGNQCIENRQLTWSAVDALEAAGLLVPWALDVANPDSSRPLLEDLQRIDQTALNRLDARALARLRDASALPIAYAQVLSMPRVGLLPKLYARRAAAQARAAQASPAIDGVLSPDGAEELVFRWDTD
ncbi:MAG: hypothetical protein GVY22_19095 [Gammaproteobacteria bacterium]|jgi:hypothetical protein|nr:hypothetical protein [Gammaproteobacteria bacterium]